MVRLRAMVCEVEPSVPVTVMVYEPGGTGGFGETVVVVTVNEGRAGGVIGDVGLGSQVGRLMVCWFDAVTTQVSVTGLLLPLGSRSRVAIAVPPGSTADGENGDETVSVNCP